MTGRSGLLVLADGPELCVVGRDGVFKPDRIGRWRFPGTPGASWARLPNTGDPTGVDYHAIVADSRGQSFFFLRGPTDNRSGWRVWQGKAAVGIWSRSDVTGGPPSPIGMNCVPDPVQSGAVLCHGGAFRDRLGSDTWRLKERS